jgi:hypothetical protein
VAGEEMRGSQEKEEGRGARTGEEHLYLKDPLPPNILEKEMKVGIEEQVKGSLIIENRHVKITWTGEEEGIEPNRKDIIRGSRERSSVWRGIIGKAILRGAARIIRREKIKDLIMTKGKDPLIKRDNQGNAPVQEKVMMLEGNLLLKWGREDLERRIEIIVPTVAVRFLQIQITASYADGAEPKRKEDHLALMSKGDHTQRSKPVNIRKGHIPWSALVNIRKRHILWKGHVNIRKGNIRK